jgi:hypothetical protein
VSHHNNDTEKVCIKTRKVYDWVVRQVDVPLISISNDALCGIFKCNGSKKDPCDVLTDSTEFTVNCTLNNDSLICQEIIQPGGRLPVTVTLPSGDDVTLEKVKILVKGTVTVTIVDATGAVVCTSTPIPFATAQTLLLCAPMGTILECHVTFFECDASLICTEDLSQLDVSITLCIDVQMEADVKLEIEARFCTPREEILAATLCPTNQFPPQCPEVFPAH